MLYNTFIKHLSNIFTHILGLYYYQDFIEIPIFIYLIYQSLLWLKADHTKHLLFYFYGYSSLLLLSFYTSCNVLFSTLLILSPALIIFCIITHQKQLQKNFVIASTKHLTPMTIPLRNWLETIVQSCLIASHHKKHITCIIERTDQIYPLLDTDFILQIPVQHKLTSFLLASTDLYEQTIFWVTQSGIIQSINATWSQLITQEILPFYQDQNKILLQAPVIITQKTDCIVFHIDPNGQTNTIWFQGTPLKSITTQQLLHYIKEILHTANTITSLPKEGIKHDSKHTTQ